MLMFLRFADIHNFSDLANAALAFVQHNFPHISLEEEFPGLSKKHILDLLSSEYLHIDSEVQVASSLVD